MKNGEKWQEINEIAAENCSRAIAKLIGRPVSVEISLAEVKEMREMPPIMDPEEIAAGIYLPITGEVKGAALLVFPKESAFILSDLLVKRKAGTTRKLTKLDESALKELGNIICGNYLAVLSNTLQVKIIEHIPSFSFDMFGAILSQVIAGFALNTDRGLVIEVRFVFQPATVAGHLLLLLGRDELGAIVNSLQGG